MKKYIIILFISVGMLFGFTNMSESSDNYQRNFPNYNFYGGYFPGKYINKFFVPHLRYRRYYSGHRYRHYSGYRYRSGSYKGRYLRNK